MLNRRSFLKATLGTTALGAPVVSSLVPGLTARASAATTLTATVVNDSGVFDNEAVSIYVTGHRSGQEGFVNADGQFVPVPPDGQEGDPLDVEIPMAGNGITTIELPQMSGRVYVLAKIDEEDELNFRVAVTPNGDRSMHYPAGWVVGQPDYFMLYDQVEFTLDDTGMFCNTTCVDDFCLPLAIQLEGTRSQITGTLVPDGRERIFSSVANTPGFDQLVRGDFRVIAPSHGIDSNLFSSSYYKDYIDDVWTKYSSTNLTVVDEVSGNTYTGHVEDGAEDGEFVFDQDVAPFSKPTTRDVFFCHGALESPNDGITGPVGATLCAAFNRSTLLSNSLEPVPDSSQFYRELVSNHYAAALHQFATDGKAYGFAYDDIGGWDTLIADTNPTSWRITFGRMNSVPTKPEA
ncbi:hypothetical protein BFN03_11705 [Rhodococcus sp. WMMA185]|uniref:beta-1,3-glucanase family protein n=1 Tax=Rhodococcus sp. WMMA185 TaxID=679318 RepID=UPI000878B958|nr:beta-1,3-glucanase family protein [Rhodococcus sp. WMMA185]AOW93087.1 hypothetical protein BFN03_11705 [Rhodococcus sp. WMMA185]